MARYFDRYSNFRFNGGMKPLPGITISEIDSDKLVLYKLGDTRLDKLSNSYYNSPYYGWFILNVNGFAGGSEVNIPDNTILKIPFPLKSSLLDYKSALETYFFYYGKL